MSSLQTYNCRTLVLVGGCDVSHPAKEIVKLSGTIIDDSEIESVTGRLPEGDFKASAIEVMQHNKGMIWKM